MSNELGEFLRTRRARISPEEKGLPRGERRRVPGLRRDELARLAGVSVEYYTRLEQGRSPNVSDSVLDAIAGALSLNDIESEHLRTLVRPTRRARPSPRGAKKLREPILAILDQVDRIPAFVLGPRLDVLAWNRLADVLYRFSEDDLHLNMPRRIFLDPQADELHPEWECAAADTVAVLRYVAARDPEDAKLAALVGELSMRSQRFRELWARHDVKEKSFGPKVVSHPLVGRMDFAFESFPLAGEKDLMLVMYVPRPGSESADKLALLASWSETFPEPEDEVAPGGGVAGPADRVEH
ncbi:helix-turn-helix transcriptional regulator [Actinocrispum sp. NPDC049592]|uniref:helix-turn-helix domain-containing protein n=1 Tax=Actinocrispum sp. NPDC049592 TaxID=3154835 RepID=UPI00342B6538